MTRGPRHTTPVAASSGDNTGEAMANTRRWTQDSDIIRNYNWAGRAGEREGRKYYVRTCGWDMSDW